MTGLFDLFSNDLLPIFLIAGTGFLLAKQFKLPARPLSQVIFYIFSPALVFNLITASQLNGEEILRMMLFATLVVMVVGGLTYMIGRLINLNRRILSAMILTSMLMNAGNFGLSVNLFAFGEDALAYASLFFVTSAIMTYTLGVLVASMGTVNFGQAMLNLLKLPTIYALALAFIFLRTGWKLPLPLARTTTLLADASIPAMLVLLGFQFQSVDWSGMLVPLAISNGMRLLIGPVLAIALSLMLGLQGAARQAGILEAAMPTAVMTTVIATEYDVEPSFVTSVVFISTILSSITLTPLLAYLGG